MIRLKIPIFERGFFLVFFLIVGIYNFHQFLNGRIYYITISVISALMIISCMTYRPTIIINGDRIIFLSSFLQREMRVIYLSEIDYIVHRNGIDINSYQLMLRNGEIVFLDNKIKVFELVDKEKRSLRQILIEDFHICQREQF